MKNPCEKHCSIELFLSQHNGRIEYNITHDQIMITCILQNNIPNVINKEIPKYLVGTTNCALCCCYKSTSWEKKWQINLNVWCANATTSILYTCKKLLWDYCLILLITLFGYMIIYVLAIFFLKLYKEQFRYLALIKKVIIMPIDYRCMVFPNYIILWLNINPSRSLISCVSPVFYWGGTQNVGIEGIIIVAEIVITPTKCTLEEVCSSA